MRSELTESNTTKLADGPGIGFLHLCTILLIGELRLACSSCTTTPPQQPIETSLSRSCMQDAITQNLKVIQVYDNRSMMHIRLGEGRLQHGKGISPKGGLYLALTGRALWRMIYFRIRLIRLIRTSSFVTFSRIRGHSRLQRSRLPQRHMPEDW